MRMKGQGRSRVGGTRRRERWAARGDARRDWWAELARWSVAARRQGPVSEGLGGRVRERVPRAEIVPSVRARLGARVLESFGCRSRLLVLIAARALRVGAWASRAE